MIQKDFILNNPMTVGKVLTELMTTLRSVPHKDALLTIYETGFPEVQIRTLIDSLRHAVPEGLKIAGISTYAIADIPVTGKGVRLNLLLTGSSDIEVVTMPCRPGEEGSAIDIMRERLAAIPDARAVQLLVCNMGLDTTRFMEESMKGNEDIGIFGTMSSRKLPETMLSKGFSFDIFDVFNRGERNIDRNQFAIGDSMITDGFVAVIFSGTELNVKFNYALGWHPIGREMPVTKGVKGALGETCLTEIDGIRPVELYEEYLGVSPDRYFISNICEFPLMVRREGIDICLIPFDYGEGGEVYFNMSLGEDEKLCFAYGTHDEVLGAVRQSMEDMDSFAPEALFLVMCGNRINFLRDDARLEWECFGEMAPGRALIHGASELYYYHGRGGVLNSAHLAIGMREGELPEERTLHQHMDMNCSHHHKVVPLSERMSVFMSKMTTQLESMAEEAQAANQAKSAFLSHMSHEIRTPINAILGMDEMILRESSDTGITGYAEDIMSAGNSLLGLVNDILDFSKIEAGKLDIIPVEYEFASVLNDLYNMIKKRAEDKGLKLELDIDPAIPAILYGDEIRVKQVITNILTNAVKYTEKGSVTLSIRRLDGNKGREQEGYGDSHGMACFRNPVSLKVSVKDTGIGIREEDRERLFGAFERVDEKRNRTIEGTGLGLNITRRLLALMDSSLSLESTYGEGSEFSFVLVQGISRDEPIGDMKSRWNRAASTHRVYRESFRAEEAYILVVDDTRMNLDVMKNLLKKTGIRIDTAGSGQEALELVRKNTYDVIFMDHRMPQMDGIECFRRMKQLPDHKCPEAPVISLTANAVSGAREEYLREGFADYLTKPIDSGRLEEMLIRYLPAGKVKLSEAPAAAGIRGKASGASSSHKTLRPHIVLIDDETMIHEVAGSILGSEYKVDCYAGGDEGMAALRDGGADMILLDVKMPDKNGFEVMEELSSDSRTSGIPVIFLTGDENRDTEIEAFETGAWDYVRKPFVPEVLRRRVRHTVELSRLQKDLAQEVNVQTLRVEHLTEEMMLALSKAVDAKDHYTNGHSERVAGYATMLAAGLGMDESHQAEIHAMGLLHDIGKIGVPGEIINKPSRLTDEEFAQIKTHTTKGYDILKTITELPGLATGARWHHERYDGSGYPDGKTGEDIPLEARIICVADCYDAMTSNRSYSSIREQQRVRDEFIRCSGTQFDPKIAQQMVAMIDRDQDYLMNEKGYEESSVAKYVRELLERRPHMSGSFTGEKPDAGEENAPAAGADTGEAELPAWLVKADGLDTEEGVKNCGSTEGYLSMLESFYSAVTDKADEIESYYRGEDWENYTIKVHALKSSARIIGAAELSERARLLEEAGDAGDIDAIRAGTNELLRMYRSYKDILSGIADPPVKDEEDERPGASEDTIRDACQALGEFIGDMDYELAGMVLDSMKEYRLGKEDGELFDRLRKCLSRLDWEGMREALKERPI